jgi:hypothetical protein
MGALAIELHVVAGSLGELFGPEQFREMEIKEPESPYCPF